MAQIIPIITDADYKASSWHTSVIGAMQPMAAKVRCKVQVYSCESANIVWESLPNVVIVTNGTMSFLSNTISRLLRMNKKIILMGFNTDNFGPGVNSVSSSHRYETIQMLAYYQNHGYNRIALVGLQRDSVNDMARYNAALASIESRAAHEDPFFFWEGSPEACLANFTDRIDDFDAAICPNGPFAISLLNHCKKLGLRVPGDIMISTFSNMMVNRLTRPSITSMLLDYRAISTQLVYTWQFLTAHHESNAAMWVWVPSELIIGESTACLPEKFFSPPLPFPAVPQPQDFDENQFFKNPDFARLIRLEKCLSDSDTT
ncbi:MAG: substrate-binding domain-containing protein, partial [Oscillospiraceae bacterium]|nr:substrate-binding domain-containing protein [Oscillospiraceae bacterium]